jgi:hypothetical protein
MTELTIGTHLITITPLTPVVRYTITANSPLNVFAIGDLDTFCEVKDLNENQIAIFDDEIDYNFAFSFPDDVPFGDYFLDFSLYNQEAIDAEFYVIAETPPLIFDIFKSNYYAPILPFINKSVFYAPMFYGIDYSVFDIFISHYYAPILPFINKSAFNAPLFTDVKINKTVFKVAFIQAFKTTFQVEFVQTVIIKSQFNAPLIGFSIFKQRFNAPLLADTSINRSRFNAPLLSIDSLVINTINPHIPVYGSF